MRAAVVGAGPVGLVLGIALARQGHEVLLVDRDSGPPASGRWQRRGVMQFALPHFFRHPLRQVLLDLAPDLWDALVAAGGRPALPPGAPEEATGLACRRETLERTLRQAAGHERRLTLLTAHADDIVREHGRVAGLVVDGERVDADLVVSAAGRGSRFADDLRAPVEGGSCGFSYIARMYRARHPEDAPVGLPSAAMYADYLAIVFPQDAATSSVLIVRPTSDRALAGLRTGPQLEAVAAQVPHLAPWVDRERFEPLTDAMPGAGLTNTYRGQLDDNGRIPLPGAVFVGDAVSTTNPAAGRGVSLGLLQARELVRLIGEGNDLHDVALELDAWCATHIRPWFEDHVYWDETLLRRFAGEDIDLEARIPSDVVCAAAQVDPQIAAASLPYIAMMAPPGVLDGVQERARAVLRTGWRPPVATGPSLAELGAVLRNAA